MNAEMLAMIMTSILATIVGSEVVKRLGNKAVGWFTEETAKLSVPVKRILVFLIAIPMAALTGTPFETLAGPLDDAMVIGLLANVLFRLAKGKPDA